MSVMRINKNRDFTVVSNIHLRDKKLSLKAKGLLTLMLSLPENWDYSVNGLACICKEGRTAIQTTLDELEQCRYLIRRKERNSRGQFECVYEIFEVPQNDSSGSDPKNDADLSIEGEPDGDEIPAENDRKSVTDAPLPENHDTKSAAESNSRDTYYKQKTKNKEQKSKTETKNREIYIAIIAYLNQQTGSNYNPDNAQTQELIESRLKEGYTPADFAKVIDRKTREWENTEFAQYLRPSTLFGDKFENYLNAPAKPSEKEKKPDMLDEIM